MYNRRSEMHISTKVKRWGNSLGLIIPAKALKKLGIEEGELVDIDIMKKAKIDGFGAFAGARPFKEEKEHEEFW